MNHLNKTLFNEMLDVVNETVYYCASSFAYDLSVLISSEPHPYIWIVHYNGTELYREIMHESICRINANTRIFIVNKSDSHLKEITDEIKNKDYSSIESFLL